MCYTQRKIQGGVGALRESNDTNFLNPNGQSRNLNVYGFLWWIKSERCREETSHKFIEMK